MTVENVAIRLFHFLLKPDVSMRNEIIEMIENIKIL
jgi:hypothetical protein